MSFFMAGAKMYGFVGGEIRPAGQWPKAKTLAQGNFISPEHVKSLSVSIKITTPFGVVIFMVEAGRVELPSENASPGTSPGADGYPGSLALPVPLPPGKPSRLGDG